MENNKKLFSSPLFIIGSLSLLFLFFVISVSYNSYFSWIYGTPVNNGVIENKEEKEIVFKDQFITLKSELENKIEQPIISGDDPQRGDKNSKITIVEYSDFSCPHCYMQEKVFSDILNKYGDEINFIRKDYPTMDKKSSSWQLAKIGRCILKQDKFWDFYNIFFSYSSIGKISDIDVILKEINLDETKLKTCVDSQEVEDEILSNIKEANKLGVDGVPYFFINNREYVGEMSFSELEKIIKFELQY